MNVLDRTVSLLLPAVPKPLVRFFSRRYIAGSTVDDAFAVARELDREGSLATLDLLGEFISTPVEATANTEAHVELVRRIADECLPGTNVSIKLTSLGLLIDRELCLDNMRQVLEQAETADNFIRIDMEDSECTTPTLAIYRTLRSEYPGRVGVVLQSRLRRTQQDIDDLIGEPCNFRLCKGIYLEPREIAYTDAEIIRRNFTLGLARMLDHGAYVGIATHDELLVWEALRLIRQHGLTPEQYEFQMLLGVDEQLRRVLLAAGHRVRIYVPFGQNWYAYSVRRLRENPQIAGYALRALFQR